jgi:hypothetical protein
MFKATEYYVSPLLPSLLEITISQLEAGDVAKVSRFDTIGLLGSALPSVGLGGGLSKWEVSDTTTSRGTCAAID